MRTAFLSLTAAAFALTGCTDRNPTLITTLNTSAAISGDIPVNPLNWRVITSGVDPNHSTMFSRFGNDAAIQHARTSVDAHYPSGSVLALVTWHQQEDSAGSEAEYPHR